MQRLFFSEKMVIAAVLVVFLPVAACFQPHTYNSQTKSFRQPQVRSVDRVQLKMESVTAKVRVIGGVAIRDNAVFMAQRPQGKAHAGLWEFPGGKVEEGESDHVALQRELNEELCISVELGSFIAKGEDGKIELICYEVNFLEEPTLTEHIASRWVPLCELSKLSVPPADVPIIAEICRLREIK